MKNGYMETYDPEKYQRTGKGDIYEHVYVYQKSNNCCLLPWGRVHHKNWIRDDNRPENLEGMMEKDHHFLHFEGNHYAKKDMSGRFCSICGSTETYMKPSGWHQWFDLPDGKFMCRKCHDKERWRNKKKRVKS